MNKLVSIRGAVTADNDKDSITTAARRLLAKIYFKNGISDADVVNIAISVTRDLSAYSVARALRENGHNVALFSAIEPQIDGELSGCIRFMVTAYSENAPRYVYLNGARALRTDLTRVYAIALDGPSGAGKSTVAKAVAQRLKITYLDTGALYRALGLVCLQAGVDVNDAAAVEECIGDVDVGISYGDGGQIITANGDDVSAKIRTPEVSMAASAVSAIPYVREKLLGLQRGIAADKSVILDGRDIGTVVLPNAEFKFFLTASPEVRANRRYFELTEKGKQVEYADVYRDIITRDHNDSTRAVAPLKKAFDATEINSDSMTAENVADFIITTVMGDIL